MRNTSLTLCVAIMGLLPAVLQAQSSTTAELSGVVADPSTAVVPGAKLMITRKTTGESRAFTTGDNGEYRFVALTPDIYDIQVQKSGFGTQKREGVTLTVGKEARLDFELSLGAMAQTLEVTTATPTIEPERTQQANTMEQQSVKNLPINRRDYLTFVLLAPGVSDSKALADSNSFRVKQTPDSGLSFYGGNGRGNNISVDGGEANDPFGGVRPTVSQEAVQEFQIDRTSYAAEFGAARGGVVNIITKGGTNTVHGSVFGFFRNQSMDTANPFYIALINNQLVRVKPDSNRQQFGATIGGPISKDRTFYFVSYEQLRRREAATVPLLTDFSIFQPTAAQQAILKTLPASQAAPLTAALTAPASTVAMFQQNSGIFPYQTDSYQGLWRIDHHSSDNNLFSLRYNASSTYDTNQNVAALVGASRGYVQEILDSTVMGSWTHLFSPRVVNEARVQYNYNDTFTGSNDPYGPAIDIAGYGLFNRDLYLPSDTYIRREEFVDNVTVIRGAHHLKFGGYTLIRQDTSDAKAFFDGRFTFGTLPGAFVSPALASTTITALQAFNLGLAQSYQQGFGDPTVRAVYPLYAVYAQDSWKSSRTVTLNFGLRYEVDHRKQPLPTNKLDFGPRFGFAWDPFKDHKTVVRGGYGVYFAPIDFQIDYVVNAVNVINGYQQIAQVLTTLNPSNPLAVNGPINIFQTLTKQGVIGIPTPQRTIQASDLAQFGISISHTTPLAPLSVVIGNSPVYKNPYAQQASLEVQRQLGQGFSLSVGTIYVRGVHLTESRDANLLTAPVDPTTGIRYWGANAANRTGLAYFVNPLLYQNNLYESTANSWYNALTVEASKRFSERSSIHFSYTFSKSIDETVDFNTDFEPNDQTCRACERALSSFDQRHKVVIYAVLSARNYSSGAGRLISGFVLSPIFRYNSARPFNLLAGTDLNGDRHSTTDRPYFAGRNIGIGPSFWTFDTRLTRRFRVTERAGLELMFEAFNLFNKLNYASVNNVVGATIPTTLTGRDDRTPSQPLGFTSTFDGRRIQLGVRFTF